jgi:hypothetical protein
MKILPKRARLCSKEYLREIRELVLYAIIYANRLLRFLSVVMVPVVWMHVPQIVFANVSTMELSYYPVRAKEL